MVPIITILTIDWARRKESPFGDNSGVDWRHLGDYPGIEGFGIGPTFNFLPLATWASLNFWERIQGFKGKGPGLTHFGEGSSTRA